MRSSRSWRRVIPLVFLAAFTVAADPSCESPTETPPPSDSIREASLVGCTDGIDNDGDGFIDCDDFSCFLDDEGASEEAQAHCFDLAEASGAECADGRDNDGDGFVDCDDWSCTRANFGATNQALEYCDVPVTPTPTAPAGCVSGDGLCPVGCRAQGDTDCTAEWSCGEPYPTEVPWLASVDGLSNTSLENALRDLIDNHNGLSYDAARRLMYGINDDIDIRADGKIEGIYTGYTTTPDGSSNPGEISTEHSWPRGDGADSYPKEGDIHHLFPTRDDANGARGSNEYGYTLCGTTGQPSCAWSSGGSKSGNATDGRGTVFQVRPEFRGDVARAHFYFSVRYNYRISGLEEATLKAWHCEDPPDDRERIRNDAIEVHQENRNPFVDRPDLVLDIADF